MISPKRRLSPNEALNGTVTEGRRALDVLLYLVQNPGQVITREELLKNVWADTFVDENSVAKSISALRRALDQITDEEALPVLLEYNRRCVPPWTMSDLRRKLEREPEVEGHGCLDMSLGVALPRRSNAGVAASAGRALPWRLRGP